MKGIVVHHQEKRRRHAYRQGGGRRVEPYPSGKFWFRMLDRATVAAGILGPAMTLPQIYDVFVLHDVLGVSIFSWAAFGTLDIPFIIYGVAHRNTLIKVTYILWIIANYSVVIGVLVYR